MKITMPHMGNLFIPLEALFTEMGHEVIVPPKCSKKTLTLGTKYAPETVCLPLKINLGNFLEAVDLGAEVIIMAGGVGPCRFGYYAEVQREIMEELGKKVHFIVLEPPRGNWRRLLKDVRQFFTNRGVSSLFRGAKLAWEKLKCIEDLENTALWARPREFTLGSTSKVLSQGLKAIRRESNCSKLREITALYQDKM